MKNHRREGRTISRIPYDGGRGEAFRQGRVPRSRPLDMVIVEVSTDAGITRLGRRLQLRLARGPTCNRGRRDDRAAGAPGPRRAGMPTEIPGLRGTDPAQTCICFGPPTASTMFAISQASTSPCGDIAGQSTGPWPAASFLIRQRQAREKIPRLCESPAYGSARPEAINRRMRGRARRLGYGCPSSCHETTLPAVFRPRAPGARRRVFRWMIDMNCPAGWTRARSPFAAGPVAKAKNRRFLEEPVLGRREDFCHAGGGAQQKGGALISPRERNACHRVSVSPDDDRRRP